MLGRFYIKLKTEKPKMSNGCGKSLLILFGSKQFFRRKTTFILKF